MTTSPPEFNAFWDDGNIEFGLLLARPVLVIGDQKPQHSFGQLGRSRAQLLIAFLAVIVVPLASAAAAAAVALEAVGDASATSGRKQVIDVIVAIAGDLAQVLADLAGLPVAAAAQVKGTGLRNLDQTQQKDSLDQSLSFPAGCVAAAVQAMLAAVIPGFGVCGGATYWTVLALSSLEVGREVEV